MGYIYKITSPTNKIYIGQAVNIKRRLSAYKRNDCKGQKRLFSSIQKHGFNNHKFEIVEECDNELLNERERFYQDLYNVLSKNGLNCKLTATNEKRLVHSKESLKKISEASKNRTWSEERKKEFSQKRKGVKLSEESKKKISIANSGKNNGMYGFVYSEEYRQKKREFKHSKETIEKIRINSKGKVKTEEHLRNISIAKSRIILDINTGVFYNNLKEVSELFEISYSTLKKRMYGTLHNNTPFIFA